MTRYVVFTISFLLFANLIVAQPVATIFGQNLTTEEVQGTRTPNGQLYEDAGPEERARAILAWSNSRLMEHVRATRKVSDDEIQARINTLEDAGMIQPFDEELIATNRIYQESFELVRDLNEPKVSDIAAVYDDVVKKFPDSSRPSKEQWMYLASEIADGGEVCCFPVTEEEYKQQLRQSVESDLLRYQVAEEMIELFDYLESETLLAEAARHAKEMEVEMEPREALRKILLFREWQYWVLLMEKQHLIVTDEQLREAVESVHGQREIWIQDIEYSANWLNVP